MPDMNSGNSLAWDAVPGALSYDVELQSATGVPLASYNVTTASIPGATLMDGRAFGNYRARVRSRDGSGPGSWSTPPFEFAYVGLPPPGNIHVA